MGKVTLAVAEASNTNKVNYLAAHGNPHYTTQLVMENKQLSSIETLGPNPGSDMVFVFDRPCI